MARLTIVVDVNDADPGLDDPQVVAEEALDDDYMRDHHGFEVELVSAEWTEPT